ncbi:thymidylate kinase [Raineyella antarctica]|uniref:Thymidylate kinase n=1 Tax=Raineyella antarctica TaxID=1577474 RepID=A0A1G6GDA0_9ACTN|nr:dTMP kinase [Raineyella antarctica]SDB79889.1 thymidylate kinase [Raineyella antarctica]
MAEPRGLFIVFEGGDGVGKTTQLALLAEHLRRAGHEVVVTREPGDTPAGAVIRRLLLDPATGDLDPRAEALLYAADKAQHLAQVVRPALERGAMVVCDRYVDSMLAYQGAGRVLDVAEVAAIADWATRGLHPDLTVLLDLDPALAVGQIADKDRLEDAGDEFHLRVRQGFLALAGADPDRYLVLAARDTRERIAARVAEAVAARQAAVSVAPGRLAP